jgi:hypothetical protein
MSEFHGVGIRDITSLSNDKLHKERTWACLDIIDEIREPSPWCLIGFLLVPKCILSYHTHANEQNM